MKSTTLVSLVLIAGLSSSSALAGSESSGGGADDYRIVPAFFRSYLEQNAPVKACFQVSNGFGVENKILEEMVRASFLAWANYIKEKRLTIVPNWRRIRTTLELSQICDGSEELTVYFGVENALVAKYRGQFSKPFGFAQLVQEEEYDKRAQAFVWIAPPRSIVPDNSSGSSESIGAPASIPVWAPATQDALTGLMLHEMGHVFGNGHVDGTVMTEKIGRYLERDTDPSQISARFVSRYSKIDTQIELVPCMECSLAYRAAETFDPLSPPGQDSDWNLAFRTLMGREPVPPVAIRYERLGSPEGSGKLTLMDATGIYTFDVNVENMIGRRDSSTPLFYGHGDTSFYSFGISYFARMRPQPGGELMVAVNYNMFDESLQGHKASILPIGGSAFYPRPIFVSAD